MPLDQDTGVSGSSRYCSMCYKDGEFRYKGNDRTEFQRMAYRGMRDRGMNPVMARIFTFTIRFAPRWKQTS